MFPATSAGFHDVYGNVWHWTEDHFNGLFDYKSHFLYDDFSSPCFDGRHNIILVCFFSDRFFVKYTIIYKGMIKLQKVFEHIILQYIIKKIIPFHCQGGSWISTGDEASRFARYAFRRHFIQHAGFRIARSVHSTELPVRLIDSEVFVLGVGVQGIIINSKEI